MNDRRRRDDRLGCGKVVWVFLRVTDRDLGGSTDSTMEWDCHWPRGIRSKHLSFDGGLYTSRVLDDWMGVFLLMDLLAGCTAPDDVDLCSHAFVTLCGKGF